jgi:hypothetical protein
METTMPAILQSLQKTRQLIQRQHFLGIVDDEGSFFLQQPERCSNINALDRKPRGDDGCRIKENLTVHQAFLPLMLLLLAPRFLLRKAFLLLRACYWTQVKEW